MFKATQSRCAWSSSSRGPISPGWVSTGSLTGKSLAIALVALFSSASVQASQTVNVYAASSLTDAMNQAIARYETDHDVDIVPVYASSSTLARQIANGAPADLYLSANEQWMDWLAAQNAPIADRIDLLANRLVLIAPKDSKLDDVTLNASTHLVDLLPDSQRLSVGDTDHVPAGIYAKQALKSLGQWQTLSSRLANGDNVRAAMALVERDETPLGIVYQTDARASDAVKTLGIFPDDSHDAITYPMAIVGEAPDEATLAFRQWLAGEDALAVFSDYGFTPLEAD